MGNMCIRLLVGIRAPFILTPSVMGKVKSPRVEEAHRDKQVMDSKVRRRVDSSKSVPWQNLPHGQAVIRVSLVSS